jgi:hypothetical protein
LYLIFNNNKMSASMNFENVWSQLSAIANVIESLPADTQKGMYIKHLDTITLYTKCRIAASQPEFAGLIDEFLANLFIITRNTAEDTKDEDESKEDPKLNKPVNRTEEWMNLQSSITEQLHTKKPFVAGDCWGDYEDRLEAEASNITDKRLSPSTPAYIPKEVEHTPSQMSYATLAVGFPNLPTSHQPSPTNNKPRPTNHKASPTTQPDVEEYVVTNYKSDRQKTTTCERHYADGKCPNIDNCWFLHASDDEGYPINWGPRQGYYTSRRNAPWRHYEAEDGSWVHEFSPNGKSWTVKSYEEYIAILIQPRTRSQTPAN